MLVILCCLRTITQKMLDHKTHINCLYFIYLFLLFCKRNINLPLCCVFDESTSQDCECALQ